MTACNGRLLTPPAPFCVNVELTSLCNQKCVMCPLTARNTLSSQRPGHMTPATWARVLPALRVIGQVQWIGYGETLLHPEALRYMAEADALGIWSSLTTNGTRLTEDACAALGRLRHLVHVSVSVDSLDPAIYRSIRKTPLAPVLRGLETLVQHVDRRKVTVGSVIMRDNVDALDGLPAYVAGLGLSKYQINVLHENKGRHVGGALDAGAEGAVARLYAACRASGISLVVDVPARLSANLGAAAGYHDAYAGTPDGATTRRCLLPWEFPFIDRDGRVFLCSNATGREDEVLGSLHEDAFMGIWHNARFQDIRRRFLGAGPLPPSCQTCTIQPLGAHPLTEYRAEILSGPVVLQPGPEQVVHLQVRNTGQAAWRAGEVAVGTVRPRDRISPLHTRHWLWVNRAAANPDPVEPGGIATFCLALSARSLDDLDRPGSPADEEAFQLVLDGKHWLAGTEFLVTHRRPRLPRPVGRVLARVPGVQALRRALHIV